MLIINYQQQRNLNMQVALFHFLAFELLIKELAKKTSSCFVVGETC